MDWSPSAKPGAHTQVEVRFESTVRRHARRTHAQGWEHLGDDAVPIRENYDEGWVPVLDDFVALVRATK